MENMYHNIISNYNKKIGARNKYYTNIIYSCSLLDLISNKIITVTEITL